MFFRFSILLLAILLYGSCTKESEMDICIEDFITSNDLVKYTGQEIEGEFYYELYSYDEGFFITVGHHYIDFVAIPQDCEGNELCEDPFDEDCLKLFDQARHLGIVAVGK